MNSLPVLGDWSARVIGQSQPSWFRRMWWHIRDHIIPHHRNHYQPHILHHRTLTLVSVLLVTVKLVTFSWVSMGSVESAYSAAITQNSVFSLTNESRKQNNVPALTYNAVLERAAQDKANDMLAKQYFAHTTPDGKTPWDFIKKQGYQYLSAGENLAVHFVDDHVLQDAWMNSPGHRANILNQHFEEMGVGISHGFFENHDTIFIVEMFGTPAEQSITVQNTPTPVAKANPTSLFSKPRPQTAKASEAVPAPTFTEPKPIEPLKEPVDALKIERTDVGLENGNVVIRSRTNPSAVKVLLTYGPRARFFHPTSNQEWKVEVPLEVVQSQTIVIRAYDLQGNKISEPLASVTPTFDARYLFGGSVQGASVEVLGQQFNAHLFEHRVYAIIIALLLACLAVIVAVHRRVFHIQMVANTAFVVILACVLLVT